MSITERLHFYIRLRILLVIIAIVTVITATSLGLTQWIGQRQFRETIEGDMMVSSSLAAALISREIELLERDAESAAMMFIMAEGDRAGVARQAMEAGGYRSISILDDAGEIVTYGEVLFTGNSYDRPEAGQAFQGETVISTTEWDINEDLVFRVWTPLDKTHILSAVLPGMLLSEKIERFRVWETGSIFIIDRKGTAIAYNRPEIVWGRRNYIYLGEGDPAYQGLGELLRRMIQGESGVGYCFFEGDQRLCAFTTIEGSEGWSLGVVAPGDEGPLARVWTALLRSHAIFLFLGILVAFFTANSIAALFFRIEEQNRRLEDLMNATANASAAKSNFLASMSHEMRTPLNAIIGLSELELGTNELVGETYDNIEKIYSSGMTLLGIINDILDISKIESGKFELIPVTYDLPSLINDTVNLNTVRIGSKPIEFRLHIEETMPARLFGDELRIKEIFNNLLSNAFKYTKEGTVDWYISGVREGAFFWIDARIEDTGIGIKEEDIPRLFTDYHQVNTKGHGHTEGTGLGLSITKRLVELMGGAITLESTYGKGSVFAVRLRQEIVDESIIGLNTAQNLVNFRYAVQRRNRNEKLVRAYIPYATVLVVDDVVMNLDVARGMLKPYGMTVDCVNSGQKAVDLVREEKVRYTAIFMDHMMPEMDGIETVQIIRNEIGTDYARTVPIIALTANAIVGNDEMFLNRGFQAFLSKPIDVLRLDGVINRWIRNKETEKRLNISMKKKEPERPALHIFSERNVPGMDIAQGLRRFDGNEEVYLQILRSYVTHSPAILDALRNISPDALEEYRVAVHGFKGSSFTICADRVGKKAEALERAAREGNTGYIDLHNGEFIEAATALIRELEQFLGEIKPLKEQQEMAAPDPELLAEVRRTAENYDMEGMERALTKLAEYHYTTGEELISWLREQGARSEFGNIIERLAKGQGTVEHP